MKKFFKKLSGFTCGLSLIYYLFIGYFYFTIPSFFTASEDEIFSIRSSPSLSVFENEKSLKATTEFSEVKKVSIKFLGVFPVKEATVNYTERQTVRVSGRPFGIRLLTSGVLVSSLSSIATDKGIVSPAADCGLQAGDLIVSIGGKAVFSNQDVVEAVNNSSGEKIELKILRGNKDMTLSVVPSLSTDGNYKIGVWVKDSAAGIGTMTFFIPSSGVFAGLGHPICDGSSGELLHLSSGEITSAEIFDVKKGSVGSPGELKGRILDKNLGSLQKNTETGVFGKMYDACYGQDMELGYKQDISLGNAQILTTIEGEEPRLYNITIEKINLNDNSMSKNMIIHITDPTLLEKTGGIVQGMSGSPIIQNGRLIGAVTHVFVNDPTRGFGIFSENMLFTAQTVEVGSATSRFKKAS